MFQQKNFPAIGTPDELRAHPIPDPRNGTDPAAG